MTHNLALGTEANGQTKLSGKITGLKDAAGATIVLKLPIANEAKDPDWEFAKTAIANTATSAITGTDSVADSTANVTFGGS